MRRSTLLVVIAITWSAVAIPTLAKPAYKKEATDAGVKDIDCRTCHLQNSSKLNDVGNWVASHKVDGHPDYAALKKHLNQ